MSDYCKSCRVDFVLDEYYSYKDNPITIEDEYRPIEFYNKLINNPDEEKKWVRSLLNMDTVPSIQSSHNFMICESCSRKGSLICIIDNDEYCISPTCDKHAEINIAKGWYEIGGDEKNLGQLRNKHWDK